MPSSRASSPARDVSYLSCIGSRVLYHWRHHRLEGLLEHRDPGVGSLPRFCPPAVNTGSLGLFHFVIGSFGIGMLRWYSVLLLLGRV